MPSELLTLTTLNKELKITLERQKLILLKSWKENKKLLAVQWFWLTNKKLPSTTSNKREQYIRDLFSTVVIDSNCHASLFFWCLFCWVLKFTTWIKFFHLFQLKILINLSFKLFVNINHYYIWVCNKSRYDPVS